MEDYRITTLEQKIDNFEEKIDNFEDKIDSLEIKLDKILFYMNNDPQTGKKGVIAEMEDLKKTISELLTREKVYQAKASVYGVVGGALVIVAGKVIAFLIPFIK